MGLLRLVLLVCISIGLSGCYLDIDVFGDGRVTSQSGSVNCTGNCTENGGLRRRYESLIATPDEGYEFLGYLGSCHGTSCGVEFGFYKPECPNFSSSGNQEGDVDPSFGNICIPVPEFVNKSVDAVFVESGSVLESSNHFGHNLCIINTNQEVDCWGRVRSLTPNLTAATQISTEEYFACAIHEAGVRCWGVAPQQTVTLFDKLTQNIELSNPSSLWTGFNHTCASDDDGNWCWGGQYQLQNRVPDSIGIPEQMDAGLYNNCVIEAGEANCWGARFSFIQTLPNSLSGVSALDFGVSHGCAIYDGNHVDCWGMFLDFSKPSIPTDFVDPSHVAATDDGVCVIDQSVLRCFPETKTFPRALSNPQKLVSSGTYVCAMDELGVVCSGGAPVADNINQPIDLAMAMEDREICAIDQLEGLVCWNNTNTTGRWPSVVTPPEGILNPIKVDVGMNHGCVIDGGNVICWGNNDSGQLDVPALSNPTAVSVGVNHSCAVDETGVVCWGSVNQSAEL